MALMLTYGFIRLLALLIWAIKFFLKKRLGIGLIAIVHFFILGNFVYWSFFLVMIFSGIFGVTLDGTEHRY